MKAWKRLAYFLLLNVFVSACTVLAVLIIWDRLQTPTASPITTNALTVATNTPTPGEAVQAPSPSPAAEEIFLSQNLEPYQVEPGDTLGLIAERFGISVEALMKVNQIPDPNSLPAGMVLYIPRPVEDQPTPASTHTPTLAPTPDLTSAATPVTEAEARIIINAVISPGDLASERVFITRSGSGELPLAGWQLRDEDGNAFIFPQLVLYQEGAVNVWTTSGVNTVVDLYWGLSTPVWRSGEKVTLVDAEGKVRATYTVP